MFISPRAQKQRERGGERERKKLTKQKVTLPRTQKANMARERPSQDLLL